jgi:hypothetical protein
MWHRKLRILLGCSYVRHCLVTEPSITYSEGTLCIIGLNRVHRAVPYDLWLRSAAMV